MSSNYFARINGTQYSQTGTGLDQLVDIMSTDYGLAGKISDQDLIGGVQAANEMNQIIVDAIAETGAGADGVFTVEDVYALNEYIRTHCLDQWTQLHGDDEDGEEYGFHLIQNDGATETYRGDNLANTVADGIYHLGFEIQNGQVLNEDGDPNATVEQLAEWLTQFYTDHSTTNTGLDRITDTVMADKGLDCNVPEAEIVTAVDAANRMNEIIVEAMEYTGVATDNAITADDVRLLNEYIRDNYLQEWMDLHGDDESDSETGFHLVQNDGANTYMFGKNFVNTVADGIYHLGFEIQDDRLVNEDGNKNATLEDVAAWLNYFYVDQSNTGTGLDEFVDAVKSDRGLSHCTSAQDINEAADAAGRMNVILIEAIETLQLAADNVISVEDVKAINEYIRVNYLQEWTELHGDDEDSEETGFHLVQNDGGSIRYRGDKLIDTVIDGIYHLGFAIEGDYILNEDGNQNASLGDLATWLNNFYLGAENTFGSENGDYIHTLNVDDQIWARAGDDRVYADAGNDQVWGGDGNDFIDGGDGDDVLYGEAGNDYLKGRAGNDTLDGGIGDDHLYGYEGEDQLTGGEGNDYLNGGDDNDTLTGGAGDDTLYGEAGDDVLDGGDGNDYLNGGDGNDTLTGGEGNDYLKGYGGDDVLDGGAGDDTLYGYDGEDQLTGGEGNDSLSGGDGNDTLSGGAGDDKLYGETGDDVLDGGDGNDYLNGGDGNDTLTGGAGDDYLKGYGGDDVMDGGDGNDTLYGYDGNDSITTGDGEDKVYAGDGDDSIYAGSDGATDYLYGEGGADTFYFNVEGAGIGTDYVKYFSSEDGDRLVIDGEGVEYVIDQDGGYHNVLLTNSETGESMGTIKVYGHLSIDDISGTATAANQVDPAPQQPLPRPDPESGRLDQLVEQMSTDLGLRGHISAQDFAGGLDAASAMNQILMEAIEFTGVALDDGQFSVDDVYALNEYIREHYQDRWAELHGDDEDNEETGFHLIQNDGSSKQYRGDNLVNTVADGIYHLGFEIQDGQVLNEDGNPNATVEQLAEWLTEFYTDHSTTDTGLDRIVDIVMADKGLDCNVPEAEIEEAVDTANTMNAILNEAIQATNAAADGSFSVDDVRAINAYIRAYYKEEWSALHGDDESDSETGFHLVQNDGANTYMFGKNFVNTVADSIYHLGYEIQGDNILNEDGNENATLTDLADWLNFFYLNPADTGTGLDELVDVVKNDTGLSHCTNAGDINEGAAAANAMNHILIEAIETLQLAADNVISVEDVKAINEYIRDKYYDQWVELHGDDEDDAETGFHLVQNDGAKERYRGDNFINTVIDSIYHLGFAIEGDYILNEDGDQNANLGDLATWLNNFYLGAENTFGSENGDYIHTLNVDDQIWARGGNDSVYADAGNDQVWGGDGDDCLDGGDGDDVLYGEAGNDYLKGRAGNDTLDGGVGNDSLYGYEGADTLIGGEGNDSLSGGDGNDTLSGGAGDDRLYGEAGDDVLDGGDGNDYLNGGDGNDTLTGGAGDDYLKGYGGDDVMDGGDGNDTLYGYDGEDQLTGGDGSDYLNGGNGADILDGGLGDDTLCGDNGDDLLAGREGDDKLYGGSGNDRLIGDVGNDYLSGDDGDDILSGGEGNDKLSGGYGADSLIAGDGDDVLYGGGDGDTLLGGTGNDQLYGQDGDDVLLGEDGNDRLDGSYGNDILVDGAGEDVLYGGDGNDVLAAISDGANDYLNGGSGADIFYFWAEGVGIGNDLVKYFSSNDGDQLVLGGPDVTFELEQLSSSHSLVSLSNEAGDSLGTIDVYGDITEANIVMLTEEQQAQVEAYYADIA